MNENVCGLGGVSSSCTGGGKVENTWGLAGMSNEVPTSQVS